MTNATTGAPTILIVENDTSVLATYTQALAHEGYNVHTATTSRQGLQQLDACRPDAVILDLGLPLAVDGLAFLEALRSHPAYAETPVEIITGHYDVEGNLEERIRRLKATVTYKPLWLEDLVRIVQRLLGRDPSAPPGST
jgi:DNA-binding response OmpR family regulator